MSAFSPSGSSQITVDVGLKTTPTIYNVAMPVGGTEYAQALPLATKSYMVRIRQTAKCELRFASMSTEYLTLPAGTMYKEERLSGTGSLTLYLTSTTDNLIAEIVAWT